MALLSHKTGLGLTAAFLAVCLAASPAAAKNDKHDDKGKHRAAAHRTQHVAHCPPGLAKKNPPCVPPGQAKKLDHGHDDGHYHVGDVLHRDQYHLISDPYLYGLPALAPGQRYVIVDDRIMQVDAESLEVMALLNLVDAILD